MNSAANIRALLRKLNKVFETIVSKELAEIGVTLPQILVVKQIYEEPRTIGQISKALDLSYSTTSGIVDRLEREGYVTRVRDQEDRRVVWIHITGKIKDVTKDVPVFQDSYFEDLLQGVTGDERDRFVTTLEKLITQIEKKIEEK